MIITNLQTANHSGIFLKKAPVTVQNKKLVIIQLKFFFVDRIQRGAQSAVLKSWWGCFSQIQSAVPYLKRGRGVFLKSHIFASVAATFYKGSPFCSMHLILTEITDSQTLAHNSLFELIALNYVVIAILRSSKLLGLLLLTGSFIALCNKKSMGIRSSDLGAHSIVPRLPIQAV